MALNPDEDTEFNDALRKHGILPPKAAPERSPSPEAGPTLSDQLAQADLDELEELADEENDSDTERFMRQYQRQKVAELRREAGGARFGTVRPIGRDDYTREITDASKEDDEGEGSGTGVVAFLYKDRLGDQIQELARRYPHTKFVSIVGDKCIPNYPDRNVPTLLMYRKGEMTNQVVAWGVAGDRSIEELEAVLIASQVINPKLEIKRRRANAEDDEDEEVPKRSIRTSRPITKDDDSDLDL
ncbi:thioredoxin-like protein [Dacryopinax primogenitus]|uniref:Thioredoxin-like protein n=1 Tax=Dacryopinax primogenitus (strain DJM 731) TaxID=1858805 RepID=M5GGL4_DACPD|nr:thioredoxin-like protein [Dacryopinax primogenitus]EJU05693.1 thioredoxin-like protein [Dacryopinax primogenitus]